MKIKTTLAIVAISILMTPQAYAKTKEGTALKTIFTKCGVGAMIFDDEPILAGLTNFFLPYSSLSATSTYFSSDDKCASGTKKVAVLIVGAYDEIEAEIAVGQGKYLTTLSELSGKSTAEIRTKFSSVLTSENYQELSKEEKAEKLFSIVNFNL